MTKGFVTTAINAISCDIKCQSQFFLLIQHEDVDGPIKFFPDLENLHRQLDIPQISLHAILDQTNRRTVRIKENVNNQDLTILIDGGSTHNFI